MGFYFSSSIETEVKDQNNIGLFYPDHSMLLCWAHLSSAAYAFPTTFLNTVCIGKLFMLTVSY